MKKYLIIIPVHNEADNIEDMISMLEEYRNECDLLIVDDGSDDQTPDILHKIDWATVIYHTGNEGYGATLIDGFQYGIDNRYQYVITIDSDKQHQPAEIRKFIDLNERSNYDILSGSRYLNIPDDGYKKAPAERRQVNQRITRKLIELTGYDLTDSFCGFKLYKVEALKKLNLSEKGYGMPLQLWIEAWRNNLTVKEVPVELIYLSRNKGVSESFRNVFSRYKYYLSLIEKEINRYENISSRSAS